MKPKPDATIALKPTLPFDFDLSSRINRLDKDYTHSVYFENTLYKCLEIEEKSSLISIKEKDNILKANLYGTNLARLEKTANWILSADLDLTPFYSTKDKVMTSLLETLYGLKPPRTASIYEALVIAITEQQISLKVALILQSRLVKRYGSEYKFGPQTYYSFPTPKRLASAEIADLRQLGLSRNKATFITDISRDLASGALDLESLKNDPTEKARENLLALRGVGPWTANYVLIRGFGKTDMVPYDDLGIRDSVGLFYNDGDRVSSEEAEEILSRFGKYEGIASYYLIYARFQRT